MNKSNIKEARDEAKRFIKACSMALYRLERERRSYFLVGVAESGACRRASMDLTRALAKLRKSEP